MPKIAKELSAPAVKALRHPGTKGRKLFSVGGAQGLYLQISENGARSWILRIKIGTHRPDIGLGSEKLVSLSEAREKARTERKDIINALQEGRDPLKERRDQRAERSRPKSKDITLGNVIQDYLSNMIDADSAKLSSKSRNQWRSTLETYIVPKLGRYPVSSITNEHILADIPQVACRLT